MVFAGVKIKYSTNSNRKGSESGILYYSMATAWSPLPQRPATQRRSKRRRIKEKGGGA